MRSVSAELARILLVLCGKSHLECLNLQPGTDTAFRVTAIGILSVVIAAGAGAWRMRIVCYLLIKIMLTVHPAASYAIASEASSYGLRAKTQGLGWFMYGLGTMVFGLVMPYLFVSSTRTLC